MTDGDLEMLSLLEKGLAQTVREEEEAQAKLQTMREEAQAKLQIMREEAQAKLQTMREEQAKEAEKQRKETAARQKLMGILSYDFARGMIRPVVVLTDPKDVLETKIRQFDMVQREKLKVDDFRFSDIFKHIDTARNIFKIGMERRDYALLDDLSEKMQDVVTKDALSIPLIAVNPQDDNDRIQIILPNLIGSNMPSEGLGKLLKRFENETTLLTRLNSPHIVNSVGVVPAKIGGQMIPIFGVATEYLEGAYTLRQIKDAALTKRYRFTPEEVIALAQPMASGLRTMHNDKDDIAPYRDPNRETMVHRGPEPSAFLVSRNGRMVLYDFTIARLFPKVEPKKSKKDATTHDDLPDNPRYMSFEQATRSKEPRQLDGVSDCQVTGIILWELMASPDADSPFVNSYDRAEVLKQVETNNYRNISKFTDKKLWKSKGKDKIDVCDTVDACMKDIPEDRLTHVDVRGGVYHAMARLDEELKGFSEQKPLAALLDSQGNYSEKKAEYVRSQLVYKLFGR